VLRTNTLIAFYAWDLTLSGAKEENFYFQLNKILQERDPNSIKYFIGKLVK
jgi:hypothetical protein